MLQIQKIFKHRYVYILLTKKRKKNDTTHYLFLFRIYRSRLPCTPLDLSETRSQRITVIIESRW